MIKKCKRVMWSIRSKNAKKKWQSESSRLRKAKSLASRWWAKCNNALSEEDKTEVWDRKCKTAEKQLNIRLVLQSNGCSRRKGICFEILCIMGVPRSDYERMDQWEKKCFSTCKNMKWKRRLRNVRKNSSQPIAEAAQLPRQLTLWEALQTQRENN